MCIRDRCRDARRLLFHARRHSHRSAASQQPEEQFLRKGLNNGYPQSRGFDRSSRCLLYTSKRHKDTCGGYSHVPDCARHSIARSLARQSGRLPLTAVRLLSDHVGPPFSRAVCRMGRHLDGRRSDLTSSIRAHRPICSALIPRMSEIRLLVQPGILTPILLGACARASPHHHLGHVLPKLSYHRPHGLLPAGTIIGRAFHAPLFKMRGQAVRSPPASGQCRQL